MTFASIAHACSFLLACLIGPAVRSLLLGCFAALALGALRVKNIAARLAVWTAVLYAALAMPLLGVVLPSVSLKVPPVAARVVSQFFEPVIAPGAAEKATGVRTTTPAPSVALLGPSPLERNAGVPPRRESERVPPYIASVAVASGSVPVFHSVIAPVPNVEMRSQPFPWTAVVSGAYLVVAALFLGRLFLGMFFSLRLVRSARTIGDSEAARLVTSRAWDAGLTVPPRLAESDSISVPVTLGILRPVILFPADWREWDAASLHAVIAHELSHVIRRDALTQRLSLLHRAIFWFSPFGWWLHRCLADAAEEASDEAALVSGADRARYAETLLGFFTALQETPRRVYWQGVSMAKAGQAEKRVDRILAWKGDVRMRMNKFVAIAMIFVGIPVVLLAAAARPSVADSSVARASVVADKGQAANPAPAAAPAKPATPSSPDPGVQPAPAAPEVAAPIVAPALPFAAPEPALQSMPAQEPFPPALTITPNITTIISPKVTTLPRFTMAFKNVVTEEQIQKMRQELNDAISRAGLAGQSRDFAEIQKNIEVQIEELQKNEAVQVQTLNGEVKVRVPKMLIGMDGFSDRYVIVSGDSPIFMSGDSQDVAHATGLRGKITGDFIWFQRDEKSYIVRDQATVNRAKELFKPQQDLGEKQQALGKQQQALGNQQQDLGKKMEAVHVQIPDMTADMQKLEAEMKQLTAGGTQQQLGDLQRQIGELQRKIGQSQFQAGDQQRQVGEQMRGLGEQQRELGQQQRALGEQQREAARQARVQMKQLLDDAVTKGAAQPE